MTTFDDESASNAGAPAQFAALLDAAVDAILVIDRDGVILRYNRAAERMFGYSVTEVVGANVSMLMPEPYRSEHQQYLQRYHATHEARIIGIGREVRARRQDGSVFPIELSVGEVGELGDRGDYYVGIIRDVTERHRAEQQARQQSERLAHVTRLGTLGEMAAGIAHEINQPLTAIATYAQAGRRLMERGELEPARLREVLGKMEAQALRAGEVIRRIRSLAREQKSHREALNVNDLVTDLIGLAEVDARLHDIEIRLDLGADLIDVNADAVQMQQVLLNLIRNAIEATSERDSTILICTRAASPEEVWIEVVDSGCGIPDTAHSEIFDPFFTTKSTGTGMGLSISRSIVAAHGGQLSGRNNSQAGATFRIALPTIVEEPPA